MGSLAQLPELVGFFSYSRDDDKAFRGALWALRDAIQRELSALLGRNDRNFRLWQDQHAIAPGDMWESAIASAIEQSVFFIPIIKSCDGGRGPPYGGAGACAEGGRTPSRRAPIARKWSSCRRGVS